MYQTFTHLCLQLEQLLLLLNYHLHHFLINLLHLYHLLFLNLQLLQIYLNILMIMLYHFLDKMPHLQILNLYE